MAKTCADCSAPATHTLTVTAPGTAPVVKLVCRLHDKGGKIDVVSDLMSQLLALRQSDGSTAETAAYCVECLLPLNDSAGSAEEREPCPVCGSTGRRFDVALTEVISLRDSVAVRGRPGGLRLEITADETRDTGTPSQRTLLISPRDKVYREEIVLADGTVIESVANLRHHR
jgi:hypothetical protein